MTDHYSDVRERDEERRIQKRADSAGISYNEQVDLDAHEEKMRKGRDLFLKKKREEELINYYMENK